MKHRYFIFFLLLIAKQGVSQECSCREKSQAIIKKIEANYIINDQLALNKNFQNFKKIINGKSFKIQKEHCNLFLYELTKTLKDKHITYYISNSDQQTFAPASYNIDSLIFLSKNKDSLEGDWIADNIKLKAIKISKNKLLFLTLESNNTKWKRGDLRAILHKYNNKWYIEYYRLNYNLVVYRPIITKNKIDFEGFFSFNREGGKQQPNQAINLFKTDSITYSYIKAANFSSPLFLDSIVAKYGSIISKTPHLIIDVRNNLGGSIRSYQGILPFIYTSPIQVESAFYRSSQDYIEKLKSNLSGIKDSVSESYKLLKNYISRAQDSLGKRIFSPGFVIKRDSVYKSPLKVSIIINNYTTSAAEMFVLAAIQSKKVILFGEKTAGGADKVDAYPFLIGCENSMITIPVSIRIAEIYKQPIDKHGIPPHVFVDETKTDIIEFVKKYH